VRLSEPLTGDYFRNRYVLALAQLDERTGFSFGHWQVLEDFIIGLQVHFVHTDARAAVLKLLGNVKDEAVQTSQDDGVTQTVQAKRGAVLADNVPVPNPVVLAPFRTFREVEQPSSAFILRLKTGGPSAALFEADGGAWRLEAVRRVSTWLQEQLAGTGVAIIA
jgi:hypothetical protein